jgi:hypothetical protein
MAIQISGTTVIDNSRNLANIGSIQAGSGGPTGTSGQVLQSTGTGVTWASAPAGGLSVTDSNVIGYNSAGIRSDSANGRLEVFGQGNFQVFTSPGTFVVNPGISSIRVRVVGAGGNGSTGRPSSFAPLPPTSVIGGGGGGGGGYAHKVITSFTAPRSYTVTVGSAPGGTSSFGSEVSATGGSNGSTPPSAQSVNGTGGSGSGGNVNFSGSPGINRFDIPPTHQFNDFAPNPQKYETGGSGGAAGTQKGTATSFEVSGLPTNNAMIKNIVTSGASPVPQTIGFSLFYDTSIVRFPFDIFNGIPGGVGTSPTPAGIYSTFRNGINGGAGAPGKTTPTNAQPSVTAGGNGGFGAGGGGGTRNPGFTFSTSGNGGNGGIGGGGGGGSYGTPIGGSGGSGGAGIVIVEW